MPDDVWEPDETEFNPDTEVSGGAEDEGGADGPEAGEVGEEPETAAVARRKGRIERTRSGGSGRVSGRRFVVRGGSVAAAEDEDAG
jgi:hypothetical protein